MKAQIALTAIFVLVASMGTAAAMPSDLFGYDTPQERAGIYNEEINKMSNQLLRAVTANQMTLHQYWLHIDTVSDRYQYKLDKYVYMYNMISVMELTDSTSQYKIALNCSA